MNELSGLFSKPPVHPCPRCGSAMTVINCRWVCQWLYCDRDARRDLAPHSDAYCAARGIRPAREDYAQNETVELPEVEFRRNVLVAAAERVWRR